jgi:hypothetical protein
MSKRIPLIMTTLVALITHGRASGQDAQAWRDSAASVQASIRALRDSLIHGDSTATEVARLGNVVITASEDQRANALEAFRFFNSMRERYFGSALPTTGGFRIVLRTESGGVLSRGESREVGAVVLAGLPDTGNTIRTQRAISASNLSTVLLDQFGEMMIANAPAPVGNWLENPPPLSTPTAERRNIAMYAFVTGMGRVQRGCVGGDYAACQLALDLHHSPRSDDGPVFFTPFMRMDLLLFTLELGGSGAWERFRDAAADGLDPALAAAARMPVDSVLARWRGGLLALRPREAPVSSRMTVAVIAWSTVLLLGTLGVSRWA